MAGLHREGAQRIQGSQDTPLALLLRQGETSWGHGALIQRPWEVFSCCRDCATGELFITRYSKNSPQEPNDLTRKVCLVHLHLSPRQGSGGGEGVSPSEAEGVTEALPSPPQGSPGSTAGA